MVTQKGKIKIAKFMGWEPYVNEGKIQLYKKGKEIKPIGELEFDSSWDWLMPVVEKIEKCEIIYEGVRKTTPNVRMENYNVSIYYQSEINSYVYGLSGQRIRFDFNDVFELTRIEAMYKAVVAFIDWYNKQ